MANTVSRPHGQRDALSPNDAWLLGAVFQKMIEAHHGCPIDYITSPEIDRWVRDRCKDEDGQVVLSEVEVVMRVLL